MFVGDYREFEEVFFTKSQPINLLAVTLRNYYMYVCMYVCVCREREGVRMMKTKKNNGKKKG